MTNNATSIQANELKAENEALKQVNEELFKKTLLYKGNWA